jgi:hypothetical protein
MNMFKIGSRKDVTARPDMRERFESKGFMLSTVLLPIEHPGGNWYETCFFADDDSEVVNRYRTHSEAVEGHKEAVAQLKAYLKGKSTTLQIGRSVLIGE